MHQILFLLCFTVFRIIKADLETEEVILKRLEATEKLVQNLFNEVASLKAQDKLHIEMISDLKKQIHLQQRRISNIGRLNRRLTASKLKTGPEEDYSVPDSFKPPIVLNNKLDGPKNRIRSLERRIENETRVAFFAKMDKQLDHAGAHQNFIFEVVVTNLGNGYNSNLGTFTAPVSGTYVFSTTLVSLYHVSGHAQIVKNGQPVTVMYVSGAESGQDTTSQTIILPLYKGDVITVQNVELDKSFFGGSHSIFSGFLLYKF